MCKEGAKGEGLIKQPSEIDRYVKCMCLGDAYEFMLHTKSKSKEKRYEKRS